VARSFLKRVLKQAKPQPAAPPVEEPPAEPATLETTLLPVEILADNLRTVTAALAAEGVASWLVSDETAIRGVVGIMADDRAGLARALARLAEDGYWVRLPNKVRPEAELATFDLAELVTLSPVLVLFTRYTLPGGSILIRGDYSCEVEVWEREERGGVEYVVAPRENRAARRLSADAFELVPTTWHGVAAVAPRPLLDRMVDDVTFPIDVVYTWVDGSDPRWLEKRARAEAEEGAFHPDATATARFADHEELRYSLRSIESYAPWVRRIFLVTDDLVPAGLDTDQPKFTVVDHRHIFADPANLPTFNSNAIISSLHRIEGLSEHYIFMNDDVFLGRWITPSDFFTPSGLAKVSPANNRRPFADARPEDEPHLNLTHNIREILRERFGITVSRAVKHTPHPQLRSVHRQIESEFPERYAATLSHRFRHHDDIVADQLFHYYAQITGKAVVASLRYEYVDLQVGERAQLEALLKRRDRDVFCLNDTPFVGTNPITGREVAEFLEAYYPLRSSFEILNDTDDSRRTNR
jgi:hypothetical protein